MMCRPEGRDLEHAIARSAADARARGLDGPALLEAVTEEVEAVWAHLPEGVVRAVASDWLREQERPNEATGVPRPG
jgi:hypothetical protein